MITIASCSRQSTAGKTAAPALLFGAVVFGKGQYTSEQITGLSISYTHMTQYSAKSFQLQEENGEALFSCRFFSDDDEIKLEKEPVSPEYMQRLREIAKKYDFASKKEKKTSNRPFVHDAPMYGMTLYWADKKNLRLNYYPDNGEVESLFREIAEECISEKLKMNKEL